MKILVICDQGNNRSVTVAGQLKYWGHDVLSAGIDTNSVLTREFLADWADRIIVTAQDQLIEFPDTSKVHLWDIGPDVYPRPYNKELLKKVKALMQEHKEEYKP